MSDGPDWKGFGKAIMQAWPDGGVDGFELQDFAEKFRVLKEVEGGFDPDRHADFYGVSERGDPWYERNYQSEQNEAKTRTAATTVNSTVNSENALDDESEKT